MKEKRSRIKKSRKEPTRERKLKNPPMQITIPWGRGASLYRPGIFTKSYFVDHGEACCADVYYGLNEELERLNKERISAGEKPLRKSTYSSFAKYFHWFKILSLVEPTGRKESAIYDFLQERVFYRLTTKGEAEEEAWEDPIKAVHPELR